MARNEIDPIDVAALVVLPVAAGMVLGVFSFSITVFGGYDFSAPLISYKNIDVTIPLLATVASTVWVVATNEIDGTNYEQEEYVAIAVALGGVPAYALIPAVEAVVVNYDVVALLIWLLIAVATVYISYRE